MFNAGLELLRNIDWTITLSSFISLALASRAIPPLYRTWVAHLAIHGKTKEVRKRALKIYELSGKG